MCSRAFGRTHNTRETARHHSIRHAPANDSLHCDSMTHTHANVCDDTCVMIRCAGATAKMKVKVEVEWAVVHVRKFWSATMMDWIVCGMRDV